MVSRPLRLRGRATSRLGSIEFILLLEGLVDALLFARLATAITIILGVGWNARDRNMRLGKASRAQLEGMRISEIQGRSETETKRQRDGETERQRQRDRETERQRDRKTERQRDRETERQRDKETKRQRDRETKRQRDRET